MPTSGINFPSGALVTGTTGRNPLLQNYVFNAGLVMPTHSQWLVDKYPQYKLVSLMERIGAWEPIVNDTLSWSVLDRTRLSSGTLSAVAGTGTATVTCTTANAADATGNNGYFIVGDVVRTEAGSILIVTAIGQSGGFQTLTLQKLDGTTNIAASEIANGEQLGHAFNAFAQGSTGPAGRIFLPSEEYNYTQVLRRGAKIATDMLQNKIWLQTESGQSWYWENEKIMFDEHFKDMEDVIVFGVRNASGNARTTRGIWDRVVTSAEGQVQNYASGTGIQESDIQNLIVKLVREGASNDLIVLCGSDAMADIQRALKSYAVNGAIEYGSFGANLTGLDFYSYKFFGKTLHFVYYELFDDSKFLTFVSTPTATKINFRKVALFLDMGSTSRGENLIKLRYRDGDAGQRKLVHKVIPGMSGVGQGNTSDTGGIAANSFDGFEVQVLSEFLVEYKLPNRSGALIANS